MAGVVHIPWYVSLFRSDAFGEALSEIASVALKYGATEFTIYRSNDDKYSYLQVAAFDTKLDFERYWLSDEFKEWRSRYGSWYHLPVVYQWHEVVASGRIERPEIVASFGSTGN
jgi:hypothetical protein